MSMSVDVGMETKIWVVPRDAKGRYAVSEAGRKDGTVGISLSSIPEDTLQIEIDGFPQYHISLRDVLVLALRAKVISSMDLR